MRQDHHRYAATCIPPSAIDRPMTSRVSPPVWDEEYEEVPNMNTRWSYVFNCELTFLAIGPGTDIPNTGNLLRNILSTLYRKHAK